jgi:DNA polymerase delta subunit 4
MPASKRARTSGGPATKGAQSTISFGNRSKVTKPTSTTYTKKDAALEVDVPEIEDIKTTIVDPEPGHISSEAAVAKQAQAELAAPKTESEVLAEKVSQTQINKYWKAREAERLSGRGLCPYFLIKWITLLTQCLQFTNKA